MSQALAKAITNAIIFPEEPLAYKSFQHVITEDDGWRTIEHILKKIPPPYY